MDNKFIVIVPVYNSELYISQCLHSILTQEYKKFEIVVIDDCSNDKTWKIVSAIHGQYPKNLHIYRNKTRLGSASGNIARMIDLWAKGREDIIVTIDGDDVLYNTQVFDKLDTVYQDTDVYMTYGKFIPMSGQYGAYGVPIPDTQTYRASGEWFASHLRTFKQKLWYELDDNDLRDTNGNYFTVAGDASYMYPLIELCGDRHLRMMDDILYVYNDISPMNDMKVKVQEQISIAKYITSKPAYKEIEDVL